MVAGDGSVVPSVVVVGDKRLADLLASGPAHWQVLPAASSVGEMWDKLENGDFPPDVSVVIFTEGTGGGVDELEQSIAEYANYATVLLVAHPDRAGGIVGKVGEFNSAAVVHVMPSNNLRQSMAVLRAATEGQVVWDDSTPAAPTPAPAAPAPAPAAPAPAPAAPAPAANYDQAPVYAPHVAEQISQGYGKPDNAIPGQITIAVMSSKGGSGKSTTALSLAGTIAKSSAAAGDPKSVVLVDLDTRDGQVGSLIGQYMPTAVNIRVMPKWDAATVKANLVHDKRLGIDALLAPVRPRNADNVGPEFYSHIIQILQSTHDVVILDCSVNYLDPLLGIAFGLSDEILFVTTLATTSVQGMARALAELFADPVDGGLGIPREKVGIVANQVINNVGMDKSKILKAAIGAPLVGQIPSEQDAVLIATNSNRMAELLKHPRLGPAYFRLAATCLPGWRLAPLAAPPPTPAPQDSGSGQGEQQKKRGGFFRR